jgi:hypothetical protein
LPVAFLWLAPATSASHITQIIDGTSDGATGRKDSVFSGVRHPHHPQIPDHAQEHEPEAGAAGASGSEEAMDREGPARKAKGNKARRVSRRAKARRKRL